MEKAIKTGDVAMIQKFLDSGEYDANTVIDDEPLLFSAVASRNLSLVKILLDRNADPNRPFVVEEPYRIMMRYPLHESICRKSIDFGPAKFTKLLLQAGAKPNINLDDTGQTALHHAAICNDINAAKILLEYGADIEMIDADGMTPLNLAAAEGFVNVLSLLIDHGKKTIKDYNINAKPGATSLLYSAAVNNHLEIVKLLIKYKADPNEIIINNDECKTTVTESVCEKGYIEMLTYLIENGGKLTNACSILATKQPSTELFSLLQNYGINLNTEEIFEEIFSTANALSLISLFLVGIIPPNSNAKKRYLQVLNLNISTNRITRMTRTMRLLKMDLPNLIEIEKTRNNPKNSANIKDACEEFLNDLIQPLHLKSLCKMEVLHNIVEHHNCIPKFAEIDETIFNLHDFMLSSEKCASCFQHLDECICGNEDMDDDITDEHRYISD